jgi:hypothetical protein
MERLLERAQSLTALIVSYLHACLGVVVVSGTLDSVVGVVVEALVTAKDAPPTK